MSSFTIENTTTIPTVLPEIPTQGDAPVGGLFTNPSITVDNEGRINYDTNFNRIIVLLSINNVIKKRGVHRVVMSIEHLYSFPYKLNTVIHWCKCFV